VSASGATISITGLSKTFTAGGTAIRAVDGISLELAPGSVTAVIGPSGSGKSTLLHLVGAIESADAGSIRVDHTDITSLSRPKLTAYRRGIGFVFQRYHLLPALTALENVLAPVLPYRVGFDKTARARELLALVGLADRERALPSRLSGGQQQRVAIARALIGSPRLVLADEPTGNLDSHTGGEILELLLRLRDESGITIVIATHEQHIAAASDRMIRLRDGRMVEDLDLSTGESRDQTLRRATGLRS
jgi:putative ABC transport system ATP-binding protein